MGFFLMEEISRKQYKMYSHSHLYKYIAYIQ